SADYLGFPAKRDDTFACSIGRFHPTQCGIQALSWGSIPRSFRLLSRQSVSQIVTRHAQQTRRRGNILAGLAKAVLDQPVDGVFKGKPFRRKSKVGIEPVVRSQRSGKGPVGLELLEIKRVAIRENN